MTMTTFSVYGFAAAVLVLATVCFGLAVFLARVVMKRALYAPNFSLLIWGEVLIIGLVACYDMDMRAMTNIALMISPLFYPLLLTPLFFFYVLSFFNVKEFRGKTSSVLVSSDGMCVELDKTWTGWYRRARGRYVYIGKGESR